MLVARISDVYRDILKGQLSKKVEETEREGNIEKDQEIDITTEMEIASTSK